MANKKVLVCIDIQNDFISGSLRNDEAFKRIPNIVYKIKEFKGDYIFVTRDTHQKNYLKTNEGKYLPVEHCIEGTPGWELDWQVKEALEKKTCPVKYINKPTFGSFELVDEISKIEGELDIEIIGFVSSICVVSNALLLKAKLYDRANISVISSCTAGLNDKNNEAAFETMRSCQINIIG